MAIQTFQQFVNWALAEGSVAKHNDGQYLGECVSLINQLCYRVLDIPADAWGHAKDWGVNSIQKEYFDLLPPGTPLREADILVYGEQYGNGLGHIEAALNDRAAIYQNRNMNGRVGTGPILPDYYVILRKKEEDMGRIQELEELANNRQKILDDIAKLYSIPAPLDGNSLPQLYNNIHMERKRIDELGALASTLEAKLNVEPGTLTKDNVIKYLSKNLK